MFFPKKPTKSNKTVNTEETQSPLDLWYHERHHDEVAFGLRVSNVLHTEQSPFQRVDVFDSIGFGRVLTLDGLMMCTEKDEFVYHELISHVPLISHPNPKSVLIIGGGDCGTLREVLRHDCVESVVMCEIDGAVVDACGKLFPNFSEAQRNSKAKICIEDGIAFVKNAQDASYDVVIVDSADPIGPGVGLFTPEFYKEVKRILKKDGIVVAQCESPWEEKLDIAQVYGNLKSAFSHVYSMVGSIPSYPYGFWSWAVASETVNPIADINMERANKIAKNSQYYNAAIHHAAFALPNFFKKKLAHIVENARE